MVLRTLLLLSVASLVSCKEFQSADLTNGNLGFECAGILSATIAWPEPLPAQVSVVWQDSPVINECEGQSIGNRGWGPVALARKTGEFKISESGFGYTAKSTLQLQIFDCVNQTELFSIEDYQVKNTQPTLCESFDLKFTK